MNKRKLIPWSEYKKSVSAPLPRYESTNIACPMCEKAILKDVNTLLCNPPMNWYVCIHCGWKGVK